MEKKARLDRIDHKILEILRRDGRISYQKLSEQVNLTARPARNAYVALSVTALSVATAR